LAAFYPPLEYGRSPWQVIGASLLLIALTAGAWAVRRRQPYLLVSWLWYVGMLVPVSGIVQVGMQAYADRFTYLPQIGLCLAATWAAADWAGERRLRRMAMAAVAVAVLSMFVVTASRQTSYWRDSITLWTHALACAQDNALTRFTLGDALGQQGRTGEAMAQYREALRLNPDYANAHNNLGLALAQQGQLDQAIVEYREALRTNPDDVDVHNNLGLALARQGRAADAIVEYREALRINPDAIDAHNNLGDSLAHQGKMAEAIAEYREALRIEPAFAEAHYNLGAALARQGQIEQAIAEYREALRINPDYADAHNNLGLILARQGQFGEAIAHVDKALQLQPSSLSHQNNLAWMLATAPEPSLRNGPRALALAMKANQATGGSNPNVIQTLAAAYAEAGQFADAVRTVLQALAMAEANTAQADELRRELKLYQTGRPFEAAH
jgi:tetratricopeptide (TPR) repeat protein